MSDLRRVIVIVSNGVSDLGKGWLAAAIGRVLIEDESSGAIVPVKVDPMLNLEVPENVGVPMDEICRNKEDVQEFVDCHGIRAARMSDDFITYRSVGLNVYPECGIVSGHLIAQFLQTNPGFVREGEVKKRTFADLSAFFAEHLLNIAERREADTLLIETGGTVSDLEQVFIPGGLRLLGRQEFAGVTPELVLLTYFETSEETDPDCYTLKSHHIRQGIRETQSCYYGLPLIAVFARRRRVPEMLDDAMLRKELANAAYEAQLSPSRIMLLPNIEGGELEQMSELIAGTGVFT